MRPREFAQDRVRLAPMHRQLALPALSAVIHVSQRGDIRKPMKKKNEPASDLKAALQREMRVERVLWSGQPDPRRAFVPLTAIWIFAIPWTVFSLFAEWTAIAQFLRAVERGRGWQVGNWLGLLWGLPFVAIGLAMMAAPLVAARRARASIYGLGEERLVHLRKGYRSLVVRSTRLDQIGTIERSEWPDGSGTLRLILGHSRDSDGDLVERWEKVEHVPNVGELEKLLNGVRDRKISEHR